MQGACTPVHICSVHIKHPTIIAKPCPPGKTPSLLDSGAGYVQAGKVAPNTTHGFRPSAWGKRDETDGRRTNGLEGR